MLTWEADGNVFRSAGMAQLKKKWVCSQWQDTNFLIQTELCPDFTHTIFVNL